MSEQVSDADRKVFNILSRHGRTTQLADLACDLHKAGLLPLNDDGTHWIMRIPLADGPDLMFTGLTCTARERLGAA